MKIQEQEIGNASCYSETVFKILSFTANAREFTFNIFTDQMKMKRQIRNLRWSNVSFSYCSMPQFTFYHVKPIVPTLFLKSICRHFYKRMWKRVQPLGNKQLPYKRINTFVKYIVKRAVTRDEGVWGHVRGIPLRSFQKGAVRAVVPFHNRCVVKFMVNQNRLETNAFQQFAHPQRPERFFIICLVIFEVKNAAE